MQFAAWGRACELATEYARRVGNRNLRLSGIGDLAQALVYGPTTVKEALERCWQIANANEGGDEFRLWTLRLIAELESMLGHFDTARELLAEAKDGYMRLGLPRYIATMGEFTGKVELLAERPNLAEEGFLSSLEGYAETGEPTADVAIVWSLLSEAIYRQGRYDEALSHARHSAELAPATDPMSNSMWRAVMGKVLARQSDYTKAEALAREAVRISNRMDQLQVRGDVLLALAEVLRLAGRSEESNQRIGEAQVLYVRKGNLVMAERARSLLQQHGSTSPSV